MAVRPGNVLEAYNDEQEVRRDSFSELDQVLSTFEHSAARARWNHEGKGVATPDQEAENVKVASHELGKSLMSMNKAKQLKYSGGDHADNPRASWTLT